MREWDLDTGLVERRLDLDHQPVPHVAEVLCLGSNLEERKQSQYYPRPRRVSCVYLGCHPFLGATLRNDALR